MEVNCLRVGFGLVVGDIFDFGGALVAVLAETEVDDLKLEAGDAARLVWSCVNGELYFLWRFSQMSLEGKMSNVGGRFFGKVTQADSLMEFFSFDGICLGNVTGSTKELLVVEMVVGKVERVVLANLGVLL